MNFSTYCIRIFIFSIVVCSVSSAYCQVTIAEIPKMSDPVVEMPPVYDSLKDFNGNFENLSDYTQYIGQQLFLPPSLYPLDLYRKARGSNERRDNVRLLSEEMENKYYTIVDVIDNVHSEGTVDATFLLRDGVNKDTLLYDAVVTSSQIFIDPFILVGYFVKQKTLYNGKTLIATQRTEHRLFWDVVKRDYVKVNPTSRWTCEVVLLKRSVLNKGSFHEFRSHFICYLLKDDKGTTIALENDEFNDENPDMWDSEGHQIDYFILEDEFIRAEKERQLKKADLIARKKKEEAIQKERDSIAKETRLIALIRKFGEYHGRMISQGKLIIGMTDEMCAASWGNPYDKSKTTVQSGVYETWYYGWKKSLHFENGILKRIDQ